MEIEFNHNYAAMARQIAKLDVDSAGVVLEGGIGIAANVAANEARRTTAFRDDTGELRGSIRVTRNGRTLTQGQMRRLRRRATRTDIRLQADSEYAHVIELGGSGSPPHPFLLPAVQNSAAAQIRAAADEMLRRIRLILRRTGR